MIEKYVLYSENYTLESGTALGEVLNCPAGKRKHLNDTGERVKYLIRFGVSGDIKYKPQHVFNSGQAIKANTNKPETQRDLHERGVGVPRIYTSPTDIRFPCVVRPMQHIRGKGFRVLTNPSQASEIDWGGSYVSELFQKINDYRFMIFGNYLIKGYKLYKHHTTANDIVRNDDHGWRLQNIGVREFPPGMVKMAFKALQVVGLDFGAIDMGWDGSRSVVYEINTGPFLNRDRLLGMRDAINMTIRDMER